MHWACVWVIWLTSYCVVRSTQVRVNLWDMAGSPEYLEVRNEFYKDAQGAVLVYDVCGRAFTLVPALHAHSVPLYSYTLASNASSFLIWCLVCEP